MNTTKDTTTAKGAHLEELTDAARALDRTRRAGQHIGDEADFLVRELQQRSIIRGEKNAA